MDWRNTYCEREMTQELKPCPFCGGSADYHFDDAQIAPYGHYHTCRQCGTNTGSYPSRDAAIEGWNRRPALAPSAPNPITAGLKGKSCRTGHFDICYAAKHDGVVCPEGECDIDSGVRASPLATPSDKQEAVKSYERHDPDNATEPFLSFIPDAKRDELIGALLASLERNSDRETDFYTVRSFIGGLGLLAAQFAPLAQSAEQDAPLDAQYAAWQAALESRVLDKPPVAFCKVEEVMDNDSMLAQVGVKRGDKLYTMDNMRDYALAFYESRVLAERKPIYQIQMIDEAWGDVTKAQYEHIDAECKRIVYLEPPAHPTPDDASDASRIAILHEVAAVVEGLPGDYRPWDCSQAITDMTRDAAMQADKEKQ
jgi:Lar family restriction alleviation protein